MDLQKLIKEGESDTLEFKENFTREVAVTAGAFANTKGGTILIGVTDGGKINGAQISNESLKDWANQISLATEPRVIPEIESLEIEDRHVVIIMIKEFPINAVMYVKEKGKITNREYQELCGVRKRQATEDLKKLWDKGIFVRVGTTGKGTYYTFKGRQRGIRGAGKTPIRQGGAWKMKQKQISMGEPTEEGVVT